MNLDSGQALEFLIDICESFMKQKISLKEEDFKNLISQMHSEWREPYVLCYYASRRGDVAKTCLKYALFNKEEVLFIKELLDRRSLDDSQIDEVLVEFNENNFIYELSECELRQYYYILNSYIDNYKRLKQLKKFQNFSVVNACVAILSYIDFPANSISPEKFYKKRDGCIKFLCSRVPKRYIEDIKRLLFEESYGEFLELMATVKSDKEVVSNTLEEAPFSWEEQVMGFVSQNEDATNFFANIDWNYLEDYDIEAQKVLTLMNNN